MDLSIIIVSWNVKEKLKENLKAIYKSDGDFQYEVFVVDNNSKDGSAEMVKNEFPRVKLIDNKENLGFAKANNQAIKQARGDFILLLNPDMKVFPDTFINMVRWMRENKQAGAAGCHLVDKQGKTIKHVRQFPRLSDQLAITLKLPHLFPSILNKYLRADFDYGAPARVDSVRGGFFMIRREMIKKVGLLDERFFLWFEEVDYCMRIKEGGGDLPAGQAGVWYTPAAECVDYIGQSFSQVKRGTAQRYFRDSMLKYFRKWHPAWQYWVLKSAWLIGMFIAWIGEKFDLERKVRT
jgi:hypothetical protein